MTSQCKCTNKHIPKPESHIKIEVNGEEVVLCPTAAFNLYKLVGEWRRLGMQPPGNLTKHYGAYVRALAKTIMM